MGRAAGKVWGKVKGVLTPWVAAVAVVTLLLVVFLTWTVGLLNDPANLQQWALAGLYGALVLATFLLTDANRRRCITTTASGCARRTSSGRTKTAYRSRWTTRRRCATPASSRTRSPPSSYTYAMDTTHEFPGGGAPTVTWRSRWA